MAEQVLCARCGTVLDANDAYWDQHHPVNTDVCRGCKSDVEVQGRHDREDADTQAELDLLRAIVDKLPKTADGVPVVPGMEVYLSYPIGLQTQWIDEHLHVRGSIRDIPPSRYSWYSTRAAAKAAKEIGDG